jgi:hypothetical protein
MAALDVELARKKRKKARLHKRRRIKHAVEKCHLPLLKQLLHASDVSVDVPLTEKVPWASSSLCCSSARPDGEH